MKKSTLDRMWDMMRLRHGIGLRCIEALPADQLDARPVNDMRTPRELIVHMYAFVRAAAESMLSGTLKYDEAAELAGVRTKQDLVRYAEQCWEAADAAIGKLTETQLASVVKVPWGEMKAAAMVVTVEDEYLHHRGQFYAFLRLMGIEPPLVWDYEGSAPEFRPRQHA